MNGAQYIAETLSAQGVSHVFFVPAILRRGLVEMEKVGIQRVVTHSEKAADYMADGYARTSRKPGVVMAQDPDAESQVNRGSVVHLTVSAGDRVVVPDVFGKPDAEAQALLRDAGLATTFANLQASEDVPQSSRWVFGVVPVGGVSSQTPDAGTLVDRGTLVKIAVRKR